MLLKNLNKIFNRIIKVGSPFELEPEKMNAYVKKFREPKDDIERSFFQYKCQIQQYNLISKFILNAGAIVIILFYLFKLKNVDYEVTLKNETAVFYSNGMTLDVLPKSLKDEYQNIIIAEESSPEILDDIGRKLIKELFIRHPFSYYFLAKNLIKIAIYNKIIDDEMCGTIICSCEYSFTSSVLTYYCNCRGVNHINIMHGEKLFFIRDAFFHFNVFYIWDEYYEKLFKKLRASIETYKVELPDSFVFGANKNKIEKKVDYKYYLQAENTEVLKKINEILLVLKKQNKTVVVRPHPIYSDYKKIKSIFKEIQIENVRKVNIEDSILETKNIISLYSTVLFQAYINDIDIVVDDCSDSIAYNELEALDYIILDKDHKNLSELL